MPSETLHIRFSPEQLEAVRVNAEKAGVTQADYLRNLVRQDDDRRNRWSVPAEQADNETLLLRAGHGDLDAQITLCCRFAKVCDDEEDFLKKIELLGCITILARLAATSGDGRAQANLGGVLLLRGDIAKAGGDDEFAQALHTDAIARFELAMNAGIADIIHHLEAAISKAGPSAVGKARSLADTIAADQDAAGVQA